MALLTADVRVGSYYYNKSSSSVVFVKYHSFNV